MNLKWETRGSHVRGWELGVQHPLTQAWIWRKLPGGKRINPYTQRELQAALCREFQLEAQVKAEHLALIGRQLAEHAAEFERD